MSHMLSTYNQLRQSTLQRGKADTQDGQTDKVREGV